MTAVLEVRQLSKHFEEVKAVDGVSFSIETGTCFGLLGPNGAGKTTTLELIEGITTPDSGEVLYKGRAVGAEFQHEAGFLFQTTAIQEFLTVQETLNLFESLYNDTVPQAELIETCALADLLKRDNRKLSGGQRQRMLLAIALINNPQIIFLDEPTTGLDPQARRNFWDMVIAIKKTGKTIILTTHYMEEAELLCDSIAIMDKGKIVDIAPTKEMLKTHFDDIIVELPRTELEKLDISEGANGIAQISYADDSAVIHTQNLHDTLGYLNHSNIDLSHLQIRNRNLEDLFLKITGRELRG